MVDFIFMCLLAEFAFGNLSVKHLPLFCPFEVFGLLQSQCWKSVAHVSLVLYLVDGLQA